MERYKIVSEFSRIVLLDVEELLNGATQISTDKEVCKQVNDAIEKVNTLRRQVCQVLGEYYD